MNKHIAFRIVLMAGAILLTAGCTDHDIDHPEHETGTFQLSIRGNMFYDILGTATFVETNDAATGEPVFLIRLTTPAAPVFNIFAAKKGTVPSTGPHLVIDVDAEDTETGYGFLSESHFVVWFIQQAGSEVRRFASDSGTLTLEEVSDEAISGTLDFTATGTDHSHHVDLEVTIIGHFNATPL